MALFRVFAQAMQALVWSPEVMRGHCIYLQPRKWGVVRVRSCSLFELPKNGLVSGKFYRKPEIFPWNMGLSLKPSHWSKESEVSPFINSGLLAPRRSHPSLFQGFFSWKLFTSRTSLRDRSELNRWIWLSWSSYSGCSFWWLFPGETETGRTIYWISPRPGWQQSGTALAD